VSTYAGILVLFIHIGAVWGFGEGLGGLLFHTRVVMNSQGVGLKWELFGGEIE